MQSPISFLDPMVQRWPGTRLLNGGSTPTPTPKMLAALNPTDLSQPIFIIF